MNGIDIEVKVIAIEYFVSMEVINDHFINILDKQIFHL